MAERPRFFDDLAGVAGGAFSALAGLREEVESTVRARVEEAIRKLDLVKRDDLEAVQEMAAKARAGQAGAEARMAALEARLAVQEARGADAVSNTSVPGAHGPGASSVEAVPEAHAPITDVPPTPL